jgi:hypothetical protein
MLYILSTKCSALPFLVMTFFIDKVMITLETFFSSCFFLEKKRHSFLPRLWVSWPDRLSVVYVYRCVASCLEPELLLLLLLVTPGLRANC